MQLCIFFLPATAVIPLHNHPEMTVFSKLLLGTMHIKSYDLVSPPSADEPVQPSNGECILCSSLLQFYAAVESVSDPNLIVFQ